MDLRSVDSKTLATLAFLDAFGAEQSLLTYFADLSGPALQYTGPMNNHLTQQTRYITVGCRNLF